MGYNIVAIGTHHKLPLENPKKIAELFSKATDNPVSIGYSILYDTDNIYPGWHEIARINKQGKGPELHLEIKEICDTVRYENLRLSIGSIDSSHEEADDIFLQCACLEPMFEYYEIENKDAGFGVRIFKDIVDFDIDFPYGERWCPFMNAIEHPYERNNRIWLDKFRKHIYKQLSLCSCDKAYYFPDQGAGDILLNKIRLSSNEWISFLMRKEYLDEGMAMQIVNLSDYIKRWKANNKTDLHTFIEDIEFHCIIDDFSDIEQIHQKDYD